MSPDQDSNQSPGSCRKTLEGYYAWFPAPLPPDVAPDWDLIRLISEADQALGELSGTGQLLPNPHLLIRPYLRREAILSSRIEDTHAEMDELALFEEEDGEFEREPDVREVANYVRALEHGLRRVRELPIGARLIKELHAILLQDVRGGESAKTPGEFRRSQNWIGPPGCSLAEATFVPPPHDELGSCLSDLENYIHGSPSEPLLVQAALIHYQFEAIHPFLDGNGRIGRLLITLLLCERGRLVQPLLYLSGFFDETRDDYYRLLLDISRKGQWREWIDYFLRGVRLQAQRALRDTRRILERYEHHQARLKLGKRVPQEAARVLDHIFANPCISITRHARRVGVSYRMAQRGIEFWMEQGLLREATGHARNRVYLAPEILDIMATPSSPLNAATAMGGHDPLAPPTK